MKQLFIKTSLCAILLSGLSLSAQNEFVKYSETVTIPIGSFTPLTTETQVRTYLTALSSSLGSATAKQYLTEYVNNREDHAIIFLQSSMAVVGGGVVLDDATHHNEFIIHDEFGQPSSYLWGTKKIMLVTLGPADIHYAPDEKESILRFANVKVEYETSFFKQSAKDLNTLAGSLLAMSAPPTVTFLTISIRVLEPTRIKAPCSVVISHKTFKEDLKFKVHEKNVASFQVGVTQTHLDKKQFKISNQQLVITLDSTQQKEWKSNMIVMLDLHLPRDVDRFEPLWKKPSLKGTGSTKFGYGVYYYTLYRTGVFGGLRLSKDPLQSFYGGFNYALSNDFYFNIGWSWHNEYQPSITNIGDIQSLDDAKAYADRKYGKSAFFWGISLSPSAMIETLGLKKE